MKLLFSILLFLTTFCSFSQKLEIITFDKSNISTTILDSTSKTKLLSQFDAKQDNTLRKKWTSRTYLLSDGKVLLEFYDKQAVLFNNIEDYKKTERVRFVKNNIVSLKKNLSYKISLTIEEGNHIVISENPPKLKNLKSDIPEHIEVNVYQLNTGQFLYIEKSKILEIATIYPDLKTLCSENINMTLKVFGADSEMVIMRKLASGDPLFDYESNEHFVLRRYEKAIIKNHQLTLVETHIIVDPFSYGNLYKSANGYYILIEDFNQLDLSNTEKIKSGMVRVYQNMEEVRLAQKSYEDSKDMEVKSEHFFQKISDTYGESFPEHVNQLIEKLPEILNIDKDELSIDTVGLDIVDESILWNSNDPNFINSWISYIIAYYGQVYISQKKEGQWKMHFDKNFQVWIPEVILNDGLPAWDWKTFYVDLFDGPLSLKSAGDWYGYSRQ
jgi:hypothetical protein